MFNVTSTQKCDKKSENISYDLKIADMNVSVQEFYYISFLHYNYSNMHQDSLTTHTFI